MNYTEYFRSNSSIPLPKLTSKEANNILLNGWSDDIDYVEEFVVLLLNKGNRVLGAVPISKGGVTGNVADPKVIFQAALAVLAFYEGVKSSKTREIYILRIKKYFYYVYFIVFTYVFVIIIRKIMILELTLNVLKINVMTINVETQCIASLHLINPFHPIHSFHPTSSSGPIQPINQFGTTNSST